MAFSVGGGGSNGLRGRRRFGGGNGSISEINIVPLVDVVLVLLIIFMLTAHVMEFGLEVDVPTVKQSRDTADDLPVISVTRDSRIFLNENPVNYNQLAEEVARRFPGAKSVFVRADRATTWDPIAQVVSALDEAKLSVKLVTKPEDSAGRRR